MRLPADPTPTSMSDSVRVEPAAAAPAAPAAPAALPARSNEASCSRRHVQCRIKGASSKAQLDYRNVHPTFPFPSLPFGPLVRNRSVTECIPARNGLSIDVDSTSIRRKFRQRNDIDSIIISHWDTVQWKIHSRIFVKYRQFSYSLSFLTVPKTFSQLTHKITVHWQ